MLCVAEDDNLKLSTLKENLAGNPAPASAFFGQSSLYSDYNVGWPESGGVTVHGPGNKPIWSCSADEHKKLMKAGKIKIKGDTGLIRYLISIGIL